MLETETVSSVEAYSSAPTPSSQPFVIEKENSTLKIITIKFDGTNYLRKTIHVLNKNEHALDMAAPVHDQLGWADGLTNDNASVKKRTNVLLLGDHIGDLGMSDGLEYENRIAVGFLQVKLQLFSITAFVFINFLLEYSIICIGNIQL
ncbi:hypothetical protein GIB67_034380 [Kingdonia uniflora]|uniref:5'-nucleotidase n=1 Tax=Kingdonia uniflora TaxID=39325 RepID=A0A7J7NST8_9MAGN|nr:hypothetical protein GIB67_034380 [Kingdonia uniflora]